MYIREKRTSVIGELNPSTEDYERDFRLVTDCKNLLIAKLERFT